MKITSNIEFDENGNQITYVYCDNRVISKQVKKAVPDSEVNMPLKKEHIINVGKSVFYLPNYEVDLIQGCINGNRNYFSLNELVAAREYLTPDSVVVDAGANIGNHTLYFANECNVKKIYAFEPVPYTFRILKRNIELNNLQGRVLLRNAGLSDRIMKGAVGSYDTCNLGGTRITDAFGGKIELVTLDSLQLTIKIDFLKIDVEGMDYKMLCGAKETILRDMPVIMIESFDEDFKNTDPLLKSFGYEIAKNLGNAEYLYVPKK